MATTQQNITSDVFVGQSALQTILSDTSIHATVLKTIQSDSFCGRQTLKTINSNSRVFITTLQTITAGASVRLPVIFYGTAQLTKLEEVTEYGEVNVFNPIPLSPTSLVAVDMGRGDAISLNWISSALRFNIYTKVGAVYTKINPNVLENVTSYIAGGLTPDVSVDFVVRALNGIGQESPDSNIATATPTFDENIYRFSNPTYTVAINSVINPYAILADIQLGYGSTFSTANFTLPIDPRLSGQPNNGDDIEITINSKIVFRGQITSRGDAIDSGSGLRIAYICHSNLLNFTHHTLYSTDVDHSDTTYNYFHILPSGKAVIYNQATANVVLSKLGIVNGPTDYPGGLDLTDQTPLAAAELLLQNIGNYKVYYDMVNDVASVYRFGSRGYAVREFQYGKNIVASDIHTSDLEVVNKLRLIGAPKKVTVRTSVDNAVWAVSPDGSSAMVFSINAKNITGIKVYGYCREKPTVIVDSSIQVGINDIDADGINNTSSINNQTSLEPFSLDIQAQQNGDVNDKNLYPAVVETRYHSAVLQSLGAKIVYTGESRSGQDQATIYITESPKLWYTITKTGMVDNKIIGKNAGVNIENGSTHVTILLSYEYNVGATIVEYSYELDPPVLEIGSGVPEKTITDNQYEIIEDSVNNYNNENDMLARMNARLNGEYARLHIDSVSGIIVILGDETLDLRSSVLINGQLLDISGITHNFQNGFLTTITLTNQPFFRNIIIPPSLVRPTNKDAERIRKLHVDTYWTDEMTRIHQDIVAAKEAQEKPVQKSGPDHVIQGYLNASGQPISG